LLATSAISPSTLSGVKAQAVEIPQIAVEWPLPEIKFSMDKIGVCCPPYITALSQTHWTTQQLHRLETSQTTVN